MMNHNYYRHSSKLILEHSISAYDTVFRPVLSCVNLTKRNMRNHKKILNYHRNSASNFETQY